MRRFPNRSYLDSLYENSDSDINDKAQHYNQHEASVHQKLTEGIEPFPFFSFNPNVTCLLIVFRFFHLFLPSAMFVISVYLAFSRFRNQDQTQ
jgi:hypothetical protein